MIDRRRFLACTGLAAAGVLLPRPLRGELEAGASAAADCADALAVARQKIVRYCARLDFPNGALHAVRALGRECPLGPGDPFVILLESMMTEKVIGDRVYLSAPVEKEGHRDSLLMNLLEKGCEPDLEFRIEGRRYTLQDCIDSARLRVEYPGTLPIDEYSWTLLVLSTQIPPEEARWMNYRGRPVDLEKILDDTSAALWADTELVRRVDLSLEDPPYDCPVLGRVCGGLHLLHSYAWALAAGYATPERRRQLEAHVQTLMRRLVYDMKVIDSVERKNVEIAGQEAASVVAFDARLKFLGHLLEIVALLERSKLHTFTPAERRELVAARDRLCAIVVANRDIRFERYRDDQVRYDSMTTGLCHVYNGLLEWEG